ncbi:MAG: glycosyltransferase [Ktedonobacteraceae bacterium]
MGSKRNPRPIRLHFFFRNPSSGGAYSVERVFDAIIGEIPSDRFTVRKIVCPFISKGLIRRALLMVWAACRQGDINHITGDINFIGLLMRRDKTVQTILDARSLQRLKGLPRAIYQLFWLTLPLRRAGRTTVISEATRREIAPYAGDGGARIRVLPCCLTVKIEALQAPPSGGPPRILQVGTTSNKNLEGVIAALEGFACVLVIVGPLSPTQLDLLRKTGLNFENHIALDDAALLEQYRRVNLVVFASTYEGFGLPILEAQALGRPVVTSNREPMRSVAGRGAILIDPDDHSDIRNAVESVLGDAKLRQKLCEDGRENALQYLPANIAAQYCALYEEMTGDKRR